MQIIALNKDYTICDFLVPLNVQWSRQYYQAGAFSVQIPYNQYSDEMVYLYRKDRKELALIDKVNYTLDSAGTKTVQLSGNFIESELDDKLVYPEFLGVGTHADIVLTTMVKKYKADIPLLQVEEAKGFATATSFSANESGLATEVYRIAQLHEMSFSVAYDYESNTKTFSMWQGLDRTQEQTQNQPVVFSTAFKNLINPDVVISKSLKNYAIVKGNYDGTDIYVVADASNGGYQKQTMIDGSSIDSEDITLAEYKAKLQQYGFNTLLNEYVAVTNIAFDVDLESYEYMKDWDLGDKVTVIIEDINLVLEARIISAYEVYKDNRLELSVEFGNQKIR